MRNNNISQHRMLNLVQLFQNFRFIMLLSSVFYFTCQLWCQLVRSQNYKHDILDVFLLIMSVFSNVNYTEDI